MNNISIVIPTWNSAQTLSATIQSCLDQTVAPLEILVCDDGSTDNSEHVVADMHDARVRWISGTHSGTPAVPRNRGLALAQGAWIAFCDSDDQWLPEKLEKQLSSAIALHCKAACTNALIKTNGVIASKKVSSWKEKTLSFKNLLKRNDIVCSSAIIHSSIFKEIGGFSEVVEYGSFADYIYWLRVTTKTDVAFVDEALVIYDDHPATSIRATFLSGELLRIKTLSDFMAWAKSKKLYWYFLQAKTQALKDTIKKTIRSKIRSC